MIQLHGVPSIGEIRHVRKQDEISKEVQAFVETYKQKAHKKDMPITKENIMHYVVEPVRIYTKSITFNNQVHAKRSTLIPDALKCLHWHDEDQPQITSIAVEYNPWCTYFMEQLGLDILELAIIKLVN